MPAPLRPLTALEARVLGVLVEKERTVPDSYPLSLNALVGGCNQKTSRAPLMEVGDAEVQAALDELRGLSLVVESSGGRVMRYAHNLPRVLGVPTEAAALVATLMLRGPQTPGELRINAERLHRFADLSSLEAYLAELAARSAGALVVELSRAPGARENRWMHLLSGPPAPGDAMPAAIAPIAGADRLAALEARVAELERDVRELRDAAGRLSDAV
ncbi:MAG TPA: YceH family protein [Casimicrobiaceae bacterium]|nr:YceH family protein [Casimicrobiaceae bacterium]